MTLYYFKWKPNRQIGRLLKVTIMKKNMTFPLRFSALLNKTVHNGQGGISMWHIHLPYLCCVLVLAGLCSGLCSGLCRCPRRRVRNQRLDVPRNQVQAVRQRSKNTGVSYAADSGRGAFPVHDFSLRHRKVNRAGVLSGHPRTRQERCGQAQSFTHFQEIIMGHSLFCKACVQIWGNQSEQHGNPVIMPASIEGTCPAISHSQPTVPLMQPCTNSKAEQPFLTV